MIRGRHHLVAAAQATMQAWLPATLDQAALDAGWATTEVPAVRGWRRPTSREMFDPAIPLIVTTSSGWVSEPEVNADGTIDAVYDLIVNPVVRGTDFEHTADLISIYAAAVRACLEQNRSLGEEWVSDLWVVGETFGEEEADQQRIRAEALIVAHVVVCSVHDRSDRPSAGGSADAPTVLTTSVTTQPLEG